MALIGNETKASLVKWFVLDKEYEATFVTYDGLEKCVKNLLERQRAFTVENVLIDSATGHIVKGVKK